MKVHSLASIIALVSVFFASAPLAQDQVLQKCVDIQPDQEQHERLQQLFKYAHIAERPKHQDNQYMWNCPQPNGQEIEAPFNIMPLAFTAFGINEIRTDLMVLSDTKPDAYGRAYLEQDDDNDALLSIGCRGNDGSTTLPIFIRIKAYYFLIGNYLNLGITFSPEVLDNDENGNITRVIWAPYFDRKNNEFVYGLRGTDPNDVPQILGNYVGDECAFPAVTIAVTHICDSFYNMVRTPTNSDVTNSDANGFFSISDSNLTEIRSANTYRTALTGHSLGGQAVQYIAENPPSLCSINGKISDNTFRAYAYASTRNPSEQAENDTSGSNCASDLVRRAILESYLIHDDELLRNLNLGNEQTGRVTTYFPDDRTWLGNRHGIDHIQTSICACLVYYGQISTQ